MVKLGVEMGIIGKQSLVFDFLGGDWEKCEKLFINKHPSMDRPLNDLSISQFGQKTFLKLVYFMLNKKFELFLCSEINQISFLPKGVNLIYFCV